MRGSSSVLRATGESDGTPVRPSGFAAVNKITSSARPCADQRRRHRRATFAEDTRVAARRKQVQAARTSTWPSCARDTRCRDALRIERFLPSPHRRPLPPMTSTGNVSRAVVASREPSGNVKMRVQHDAQRLAVFEARQPHRHQRVISRARCRLPTIIASCVARSM